MSEPYYILDVVASECEDYLVWWRHEGRGMTTRLDMAGKFTQAQIDRMELNKRVRAVPCAEVDSVAVAVVSADPHKFWNQAGWELAMARKRERGKPPEL